MKTETITILLASWGAILSSFAVCWQFYRDVIQRGRLKVSCYLGEKIGSRRDPNTYLIYCITNVGKEQLMVTHIGGEQKGANDFIFPSEKIPRMLQPGEYILETLTDFSVLDNSLKCLTATDSFGRVWKAPRKQIKKLKMKYESGQFSKNNK